MVDGKTLTALAQKNVTTEMLQRTLNDGSFQDFARILILTAFGTARTNEDGWFSYTFGIKLKDDVKFIVVNVSTMRPAITNESSEVN